MMGRFHIFVRSRCSWRPVGTAETVSIAYAVALLLRPALVRITNDRGRVLNPSARDVRAMLFALDVETLAGSFRQSVEGSALRLGSPWVMAEKP